jgi:hypothetical protein
VAEAKRRSRRPREIEHPRPTRFPICGRAWPRSARSLSARSPPPTIPARRRIPGSSAIQRPARRISGSRCRRRKPPDCSLMRCRRSRTVCEAACRRIGARRVRATALPAGRDPPSTRRNGGLRLPPSLFERWRMPPTRPTSCVLALHLHRNPPSRRVTPYEL